VRVYQNLGKFDEAIERSRQAATLFTEVRDLYGIGQVKRNLGKLYRMMNQLDRASESFTEAIELFNRTDAAQESEATKEELSALTKKTRLPWWAWLALVLFALLILILSVVIIIIIR